MCAATLMDSMNSPGLIRSQTLVVFKTNIKRSDLCLALTTYML